MNPRSRLRWRPPATIAFVPQRSAVKLARSSPLSFASLALVAAAVAACGTPPPRYPIREPDRVLAVLRARDQRFTSLRARGSADHYGQQGRVRGTVEIFVRSPDHMRVDTFAFGHLVSSMISNGEQFTLLQGTQYLVGPARPCVAQQLLGIPMEAREVVAVLSGGAPLLSDRLHAPRWENGFYLVDVEGENGASELLELSLPTGQRDLPAAQQTPQLHRVVLRDRNGIRAEITYLGYRDVQGTQFPDRVRIVMPRDHADTQIRFDEVVPNFTVPANPDDPGAAPPDPFEQHRPDGASETPINC